MYNLVQIFDFQDGGHSPFCICHLCIWTTHEEHLVVFIVVQTVVITDGVVLIICMF